MIKILLYLLDKFPYRTKFGFSIADELKVIYYKKIGQFKVPERCLCGGIVKTWTYYRRQGEVSWETTCQRCGFLADED
jgi:hypothetical protein